MNKFQKILPTLALTGALSGCDTPVAPPYGSGASSRTNSSNSQPAETKQTTIALSPDLINAVLSGREKATIRKGRRNYPLGPAVFDAKTAKIRIEIIELEIKQFKNLTNNDGRLDGGVSKDELQASLRTYYPDIKDDDEVTVVHFKLAN